MFAYIILSVHWFNPLAWAAFLLMGADMEMSCDERVMRQLGEGIRHDYSMTLVRVAANRRIIAGSPLAFGEGGMKERVKRVLNFKKPSRIIIIVAAMLVVVLSVGFAVNRTDSPAKTLQLPDADSVTVLQLEKMSDHKSIGAFEYRDKTDIAAALSALSDLTLTSKRSVNDSPNVNDFLFIRFITDDIGYTAYLYSTEENKTVIEQPYIGVFGIGATATEELNRLWGNGKSAIPSYFVSAATDESASTTLPLQSPGVYFGVNDSPINPAYETVYAQLMNLSSENINCSPRFTIESDSGGEWITVPFVDSFAFEDISFRIDPNASYDYFFTPKMLNETLAEGNYRFVAEIWSDDITRNWISATYNTYKIYAPFNISKDALLPKEAEIPPKDWSGNLNGREMTLKEAQGFVADKENLTISDLAEFKGGNVSSNFDFYIMVYSVEEGYRLIVRAGTDRKVSSISLEKIEVKPEPLPTPHDDPIAITIAELETAGATGIAVEHVGTQAPETDGATGIKSEVMVVRARYTDSKGIAQDMNYTYRKPENTGVWSHTEQTPWIEHHPFEQAVPAPGTLSDDLEAARSVALSYYSGNVFNCQPIFDKSVYEGVIDKSKVKTAMAAFYIALPETHDTEPPRLIVLTREDGGDWQVIYEGE